MILPNQIFPLNNRYVPMIRNTNKTPETTKRVVSQTKPRVNGIGNQ